MPFGFQKNLVLNFAIEEETHIRYKNFSVHVNHGKICYSYTDEELKAIEEQ